MNPHQFTYTTNLPDMPVSPGHIVASSEKVSFPAVGTRLVFTEDDVESGAEEGDEIVVRDVGKCGFECSNGIVYGPNWRDGLEPIPTPPVRPEGVPYEGDEWIYAGAGPLEKAGQSSLGHVIRFDHLYQQPDWDRGAKWRGHLSSGHYALRRGSPIHRAQPWFHESQVVAGKLSITILDGFTELAIKGQAEATGSYPPDESEWPEKLPAPKGCVWERVKAGEELSHGEIYLALYYKAGDSGKMEWRNWICPTSGIIQTQGGTLLMKSVPAPQWRDMLPEETIQGGDEVDRGAGYVPADASIGLIVGHSKARTRRPLPPSDYVDPVSGVEAPAGRKAREFFMNVYPNRQKSVWNDRRSAEAFRGESGETIQVREIFNGIGGAE